MIRRLVLGTASVNPAGGNGPNQSQSRASKANRCCALVGFSSLEQAWDARAEFAAQFIPAGARVLDLGCGRMSVALSAERMQLSALRSGRAQRRHHRLRFQCRRVPDPGRGASRHHRHARRAGIYRRRRNRFHPPALLQARRGDELWRPTSAATVRRAANHLSFYDLALLFDRYGFASNAPRRSTTCRC